MNKNSNSPLAVDSSDIEGFSGKQSQVIILLYAFFSLETKWFSSKSLE
jgi:hypothetical protein